MTKYRLRSNSLEFDLSSPAHIPQPRVFDLAVPATHVHEVFDPQDGIARLVTVALSKGSVSAQARKMRAVLTKKPSLAALQAAIGLANQGTAIRPNFRRRNGQTPADSARKIRDFEVYYRAQYVEAAARRIDATLLSGYSLKVAIAKERANWQAHEQARKNRLEVAQNVNDAAQAYGPLLGWYLNPLMNNEADCIAANGHNFNADEGTVIGLPGSVHPHCGCTSGPPIDGAAMVNDIIRKTIKVRRKGRAKRVSLKAS